jgi:hypothetical protein
VQADEPQSEGVEPKPKVNLILCGVVFRKDRRMGDSAAIGGLAEARLFFTSILFL